ncbi:MAG: nucleoside deaminase [Bacteroidales bacterium]|jgi:tRNA(adenine34) deaminase|nr:nucleoside deaminase [Bacteroidales bacterium]MBQ1938007.1 nucleoside deaminase [Bacteroidales bacterium]
MEEDIKYMRAALEQAQEALEMGEIPIGAVVVAAGQIIARGHNMTEMLHDPTAHAEMLALTSATEQLGGKYLQQCTLYVTVEPCPMCAAALNWAQVGRIVYGAEDPKRGFSLFQPSLLHPKTKITKSILEEECSCLMKDFFKSLRK